MSSECVCVVGLEAPRGGEGGKGSDRGGGSVVTLMYFGWNTPWAMIIITLKYFGW